MLDLPEQLGPLRTMQAAATDQGSRKSASHHRACAIAGTERLQSPPGGSRVPASRRRSERKGSGLRDVYRRDLSHRTSDVAMPRRIAPIAATGSILVELSGRLGPDSGFLAWKSCTRWSGCPSNQTSSPRRLTSRAPEALVRVPTHRRRGTSADLRTI